MLKEKAKNDMPKINILDALSSDLKMADEKTRMQVALITMVLFVISTALLVAKIHLPYVPAFFLIDFSILPILLSSIAYGPIIGSILCVIKFILQIVFFHSDLVSGFTGFALDTFFVTASGATYAIQKYKFIISMRIAMINNEPPRVFKKGKNIFLICLVVALITCIIQLVATPTISYHALELLRGIKIESVLVEYQKSMYLLKTSAPAWFARFLPDVNNVFVGVLIYNVPITFLKYFISSCLCAVSYGFLSPVLHRR